MKLLMVGPGKGKPGGILALVEALTPVLEQKLNLFYFPTVRRFSTNEMGLVSARNIWLALSQYARFLRDLYRFRPQIVHIHTSQGLGWLKDSFYVVVSNLFGCKIVLHVHAAEYDQLYGKKPRLWQQYTRKIMNMADAVIAVSAEWKKALAAIVPADRIYTFKPCLDVAVFEQKRPLPANGTVNAFFMGTVGGRKGTFDLVEAMGRPPVQQTSLHTWIAGDEEKQGDLQKISATLDALQLAEKCELVGTVQGERKAQLLRDADIFVLPSYNEGLPFAIIEAMAAGLPVVATPVGGIPEIIRDGENGFLVSPGDVDGLAERLAQLAIDPALRQTMGEHNRRYAERELDIRPYTQRLLNLYQTLLTT